MLKNINWSLNCVAFIWNMIFYEYFDVSTNVFDVSRMIDKCVSTKLDEIVFVWNFFFLATKHFNTSTNSRGVLVVSGKKIIEVIQNFRVNKLNIFPRVPLACIFSFHTRKKERKKILLLHKRERERILLQLSGPRYHLVVRSAALCPQPSG